MIVFNTLKHFDLSETEMIFDGIFHPSIANCLALSTIEGDIIM